MLIFDEVKTGAKLARGGACEYYGITPDIVTLGKSIGGCFPLAASAARTDTMQQIAQQKMFHAGTYNTNPVVMAAGLAASRELLTPYWWHEQWTISVQHTDDDIDQHLQAFGEIAPALATAQQERQTVPLHA